MAWARSAEASALSMLAIGRMFQRATAALRRLIFFTLALHWITDQQYEDQNNGLVLAASSTWQQSQHC
jgi:hypothetical protein